MSGELHFANLTWTQVRELIDSERIPVLLWPVGSTEPHGPHSPLATDPLISLGMCERAARELADDPELQARILPPLAYGVTRYTAAFPGGIHVQEDTLHAMLTDVLLSLVHQGFRHNVIVNNHFEPEHVRTIHRAIDTVRETTGVLTGYLDLTRRHRAERLTEEFREGGSHAGRYETSLILADHPELVDASVLSSLPPAPVNLASEIAGGAKDFVEMGLTQAYNGNPAEASAAEGRETYAVLTEMLVSLTRELVAGTGGRDQSGMYGRV
jgi:creatinine amidohydrolase